MQPEVLLQAISGLRPVPFLVLLGLALLDRVLMAVKWSQLLAAVGVRLSVRKAIAAYLKASFVNRVVPTSLGGDLVRGAAATRDSSREPVVASMVMEKAIGVLGAVTLATVGARLLGSDVPGLRSMVWALAALGAALLSLLLLSLSQRVVRTLFRPLAGISNRLGVRQLASRLHAAYREYRSRPAALIAHFLLTLLEQAVQVTVVFLCARSVGVETPLALLLPVIAMSELVRKLALVLEGWGLGELMRVLIFTLAAIDPSRAVAVSVLYHAVVWIIALPGAILLVLHRPAATPART